MSGGLRIAGVVPCAGRSRRMGADKATLDAGGETFLERAVSTLAAVCDPVVVVVEAHRTDLAERARSAGATVVVNPDPSQGPISSLRAALFAEGSEWDALLLLPVDHPAVSDETVRAVRAAFAERATGGTAPGGRGSASADGPESDDGSRSAGRGEDGDAPAIVVPVHRDRTGHPPLFGRAVFEELLDAGLEGGARAVLHRDPDRVVRVEVDDPGVLHDLDTAQLWTEAVRAGELDAPAPIDLATAADRIVQAIESGREAVLVTRLDPLPPRRLLLVATPDRTQLSSHGTLGEVTLDAEVRTRALPILAGRVPEGDLEVDGVPLYLEAHRPQPELVIVGAGHISLPLAEVGAVLGFRIRVLDDRPEFARAERFADGVDVRRVDFADAFAGVPIGPLTHLVLVTRGHKYDYECLRQVLRLPVQPRYIGLIGSRRRVRATFVQLLAEGLDRERVASVRAPVGLDLGAETPGEIAVAVAAEIVREWRGGTGDPLREKERILDRFFTENGEEAR